MASFLSIAVNWFDNDVTEVIVSASNIAFAATAYCYIAPDGLKELALNLSGFPKNHEDIRKVTLGTMNPKYAGGGVSIALKCKDRMGHVSAHLEFRNPTTNDSEESAAFYLALEPQAINDFASRLSNMEVAKGETAIINGAT